MKKLLLFSLFIFLGCSQSDDNSDKHQIIYITAQRNLNDYNSIRELMASITDASEFKQYVINIPAGMWRECDIVGKKYVKLKGAGVDKTILINDSDAMADLYTPSDYSFPNWAGKKLSDVPQDFKHVVHALADIEIEDLTLQAVKCKYSAHFDSGSYQKITAKNVKFKEQNCNFPIGIGTGNGQELTFQQCFLERSSINLGVFVHNWNNQSKKAIVTFDGCKFINCSYLLVDELGSEQEDEINLFNCTTTLGENAGHIQLMVDKTSEGTTYWINSEGIEEPNPVNVPYCWILKITGTAINTIESNDSGNFNSAWAGIPQRDVNLVKIIQ